VRGQPPAADVEVADVFNEAGERGYVPAGRCSTTALRSTCGGTPMFVIGIERRCVAGVLLT
jgi:hypothetical protein